jgi:hypothetical protein
MAKTLSNRSLQPPASVSVGRCTVPLLVCAIHCIPPTRCKQRPIVVEFHHQNLALVHYAVGTTTDRQHLRRRAVACKDIVRRQRPVENEYNQRTGSHSTRHLGSVSAIVHKHKQCGYASFIIHHSSSSLMVRWLECARYTGNRSNIPRDCHRADRSGCARLRSWCIDQCYRLPLQRHGRCIGTLVSDALADIQC